MSLTFLGCRCIQIHQEVLVCTENIEENYQTHQDAHQTHQNAHQVLCKG